MRVHRNAKATPKMRQLLTDHVTRHGWTQAATAADEGVSVRTVVKWLARARRGDAALGGCPVTAVSPAPHARPTLAAAILAYRHQRATAWAISGRTGVPRSTVTRVLARAGLNRPRALKAPPVVQRYEWPHAGDLLHLDIKPLARIRGIGHRIHGDRTRSQAGVGYEYAHVAIDDATRLAYVEVRR